MKEKNINIKEQKQEKQPIKQPSDWEEIESPNFFKFENIGDKLEGILTSKDESKRYGFGLYTITLFNGETKRFHGSNQLDDLLLNLETPSYVQILYIDNQITPNGEMKLFKVSKGKNI